MPPITKPIDTPSAHPRPAVTGAAGAYRVDGAAVPPASAARPDVQISAIGARLGKAEGAQAGTLSGDQVRANIDTINYPLTPENKARMAQQVPQPADAAALASAAAANAYVDNLGGPNPFAGLSREQLWTVANDDSGTFTTNERYAAYRQAYDEEQAWRTKAVADAMREYHETGKLTDFFKSALAHFDTLPAAEQALYPSDYAADLGGKIALDFNYYTHRPHGEPGAAAGSIAALHGNDDGVKGMLGLPDVF
ncbi:hypothetical protein IP92_04804 [Pseudoduganella flava]|uniref:Uncharacterized protein n=1 Tax=Pseudoduganella flava TaxID=871742 RepID=A0A562PH37_9BURK|nr:hypothetical protein [Pseudoduganella flava]QGZ42596.1 hypothetical protein GO485_28550 [Pseudoduganella flava]TWI43751.1 hypothetical protein IP92_04804 [Pseudoduganella flava]